MISRESNGPMILTGDLHIHSALSPCAEDRMTPPEVLKKLIALGIDIFSITDHNSGSNCSAFAEAAKKHEILFIPGIELQSSEEIHLLGYFRDIGALDEFCSATVRPGLMPGIKNDPSRFGKQLRIDSEGNALGEEESMLGMPLSFSIDELVHGIHEFGGIAVGAHLDRGFSVISQLGFMPPELDLDAVEVRDIKKMDDLRSTFLKDRPLNVLSSSDSHYLNMMIPPKMKFRLDDMNAKSCLECISGGEEGRITIVRKRGGKRPGKPKNSTGEVPSKRDWKTLYQR